MHILYTILQCFCLVSMSSQITITKPEERQVSCQRIDFFRNLIFSDKIRNHSAIRETESLGGSKDYNSHPDSPPAPLYPSRFHTLADWGQVAPVTGSLKSYLIETSLNMVATGADQSGSGDSWGFGIGGSSFAGVLGFESWDSLKEASNDFSILVGSEGVGAVVIYLSIDGNPVGVVVAAAGGLEDAVGIDGSFTWK
ncbi:hypothetical protein FIBSPDRAFT_903622 [Athelia psychrophila]|uniref:Uncharacterized protein n=1 Tax=Athelia psychrophila TaxID=1759441 RepID=A0A167VRW9_9AGAM|nr:hypothetical protein FIBSPDRAFT_903622 [Fibularhizoctonia sp. CBS 109695]